MIANNNPKGWNEVKTNDSWAIFKIMGEFVNGYEKLGLIGPCVSIFGSARTKPEDPYYKLAERIAAKITEHGYGVITGGGPGIMEAANKGAAIAHQVHGAIGYTGEHILQRFTRRMWGWRDDFGSEAEWAVELGNFVAREGADELWPKLAAR